MGGDADYSKFYLFGDLSLCGFVSLEITRDKVTQGFSHIYWEYGEENIFLFSFIYIKHSPKVKLGGTKGVFKNLSFLERQIGKTPEFFTNSSRVAEKNSVFCQ